MALRSYGTISQEEKNRQHQIELITEQKYKDALVRIELNRNPALRCHDMKHLSCTAAMARDNERLAAYINSIYSELPLSAHHCKAKCCTGMPGAFDATGGT